MNHAEVQLYERRSLTDGYPNLQQIGSEYFAAHQADPSTRYIDEVLKAIDVLLPPAAEVRRIAVTGCGQDPHSLKRLLEQGYVATGVEPIEEFVELARQAVGERERVLLGCAEGLPLESGSQDVIWLESVLEHVDSVPKSLAEAYRVLAPGGLLYVKTTNRWRLSLLGTNHEFRVPFFNWFPAIVKECYVFAHLHYKPHLANYTPRPAVHWFTYPELCRLGREAGFAHFYSLLDVLTLDSAHMSGSFLRRTLVRLARRNLWIKALALSQVGGTVFMWKRAK
ncbi:MAG: class I SAM-dependent methyltransferase [Pirellulales bacterium]